MNKYCVHKSYTIKEVIDVIDTSHDRVALVVNENESIIGIVSQGDIIRALSSGKNLYTQVEKIIKSSFLYLKERDMSMAYSIFRNKRITLLPIVSDDFKLLDVITLTDIYDYLRGGEDE